MSSTHAPSSTGVSGTTVSTGSEWQRPALSLFAPRPHSPPVKPTQFSHRLPLHSARRAESTARHDYAQLVSAMKRDSITAASVAALEESKRLVQQFHENSRVHKSIHLRIPSDVIHSNSSLPTSSHAISDESRSVLRTPSYSQLIQSLQRITTTRTLTGTRSQEPLLHTHEKSKPMESRITAIDLKARHQPLSGMHQYQYGKRRTNLVGSILSQTQDEDKENKSSKSHIAEEKEQESVTGVGNSNVGAENHQDEPKEVKEGERVAGDGTPEAPTIETDFKQGDANEAFPSTASNDETEAVVHVVIQPFAASSSNQTSPLAPSAETATVTADETFPTPTMTSNPSHQHSVSLVQALAGDFHPSSSDSTPMIGLRTVNSPDESKLPSKLRIEHSGSNRVIANEIFEQEEEEQEELIGIQKVDLPVDEFLSTKERDAAQSNHPSKESSPFVVNELTNAWKQLKRSERMAWLKQKGFNRPTPSISQQDTSTSTTAPMVPWIPTRTLTTQHVTIEQIQAAAAAISTPVITHSPRRFTPAVAASAFSPTSPSKRIGGGFIKQQGYIKPQAAPPSSPTALKPIVPATTSVTSLSTRDSVSTTTSKSPKGSRRSQSRSPNSSKRIQPITQNDINDVSTNMMSDLSSLQLSPVTSPHPIRASIEFHLGNSKVEQQAAAIPIPSVITHDPLIGVSPTSSLASLLSSHSYALDPDSDVDINLEIDMPRFHPEPESISDFKGEVPADNGKKQVEIDAAYSPTAPFTTVSIPTQTESVQTSLTSSAKEAAQGLPTESPSSSSPQQPFIKPYPATRSTLPSASASSFSTSRSHKQSQPVAVAAKSNRKATTSSAKSVETIKTAVPVQKQQSSRKKKPIVTAPCIVDVAPWEVNISTSFETIAFQSVPRLQNAKLLRESDLEEEQEATVKPSSDALATSNPVDLTVQPKNLAYLSQFHLLDSEEPSTVRLACGYRSRLLRNHFSRWYYRHTHPIDEDEGPRQKLRRYLARQQANYSDALSSSTNKQVSQSALKAGFVAPAGTSIRGEKNRIGGAFAEIVAYHKALARLQQRTRLRLLASVYKQWYSLAASILELYNIGKQHAQRGCINHWRKWTITQVRHRPLNDIDHLQRYRQGTSDLSSSDLTSGTTDAVSASELFSSVVAYQRRTAQRGAVRSWGRYVDRMKRLRHWSNVRQSQLRSEATALCWQVWRKRLSQQRTMTSFASSRYQTLVRDAFSFWISRLRFFRYVTSVAIAIHESQPFKLSSCFGAWWRLFKIRRFQRAHQIRRAVFVWKEYRNCREPQPHILAAINNWNNLQLSRRIAQWRRFCRHQLFESRRRKQATDHHETALAQRCFNQWSLRWENSKKIHASKAHYDERRKFVHFHAWKIWTNQWREQRQFRSKHLASEFRVLPAIVHWQLWLHQRRDQKQQIEQFIRDYQARSVRHVWIEWRGWFQYLRAHRRTVSLRISQWRRKCDLANQAQKIAVVQKRRIAIRCIKYWHQQLVNFQSQSIIASEFERRIVLHRWKSIIWSGWYGRIRDRRMLKRRMWIYWRRAVTQTKRIKSFQHAVFTFDCHTAMRTWHQCAVRSLRVVQVESQIRRRRELEIKNRYLVQWYQSKVRTSMVRSLVCTIESVVHRLSQRHVLNWIWHMNHREVQLVKLTEEHDHRRRRRKVRVAIEEWHRQARRLNLHRRLIKFNEAAARQFRLIRALHRWKRVHALQASLSHRSSIIASNHSARLISHYWQSWHQHMYQSSFIKFEASMVFDHRIRRFVNRWKKLVSYRRAYRGAIQAAIVVNRTTLLKQSWQSWKFHHKKNRYQSACVAWLSSFVERRMVRQVIRVEWRGFVRLAREQRLKEQRLENIENSIILGRTAHILRYWLGLTRWKIADDHRIMQSLADWQLQRKKEALNQWCTVIHHNKKMWQAIDRVHHMRGRNLARTIWTEWRIATAKRRRLISLMRTTLTRWNSIAFTCVRVRMAIIKISAKRRFKQIKALFEKWRVRYVHVEWSERQVDRVLLIRSRRRQLQVVRKWYLIAKSNSKRAQSENRITQKVEHHLKHRAWSMWQWCVVMRRNARWLSSTHIHLSKSRYWDEWIRAIQHKQRLARLTLQLQPRIEALQLNRFLRHWRDVLRRCQQLQRDRIEFVQHRLRLHEKRSRLRQWLHRAQIKHKLATLQEASHSFRQRQLLLRFTRQWLAFSRRRSLFQVAPSEWLQRHQRRQMRGNWVQWKRRTQMAIACKHLDRMIIEVQKRSVFQLLQARVEEHDESIRLMKLAVQFDDRRLARTRLVALDRWQTRAQAHQAHCMRLAKMAMKAADFQRRIVVRTHYRLWKDRLTSLRDDVRKTQEAATFRCQCLLSDAWKQWRAQYCFRIHLRQRWRTLVARSHRLLTDEYRLTTPVTLLITFGHGAMVRFRQIVMAYFVQPLQATLPSSSSSLSSLSSSSSSSSFLSLPPPSSSSSALPLLFSAWRDLRSDRRRVHLATEWFISQFRKKILRAWFAFVSGKKKRILQVARRMRGEASGDAAFHQSSCDVSEALESISMSSNRDSAALARAYVHTHSTVLSKRLTRLESMESTADNIVQQLRLKHAWRQWRQIGKQRALQYNVDLLAQLHYIGHTQRTSVQQWRSLIRRKRNTRVMHQLAEHADLCFSVRRAFYAWLEQRRATISHEEKHEESYIHARPEQIEALKSTNLVTSSRNAAILAEVDAELAVNHTLMQTPTIDSIPPEVTMSSSAPINQISENFFYPRVIPQLDELLKPLQSSEFHTSSSQGYGLAALLAIAEQSQTLHRSVSIEEPNPLALSPPRSSHTLQGLADLSSASFLLSPRSAVTQSLNSHSNTVHAPSLSIGDEVGDNNRSELMEQIGDDAYVCLLLRRTFYRWQESTVSRLQAQSPAPLH